MGAEPPRCAICDPATQAASLVLRSTAVSMPEPAGRLLLDEPADTLGPGPILSVRKIRSLSTCQGARMKADRSGVRWSVGMLVLLSASVLAPPGRADSIVYDFEDGTTQGWIFAGAALHRTYDVFGDGEAMAVFGTDGSGIFLTLDLTEVTRMTWELFAPWLGPDHAANLTTYVLLRPGASPPFDLFLPMPVALSNPGEMTIDLSAVTGVHEVGIAWSEILTLPGDEPPAPTLHHTAFINTITFHLVPEPAGLATMGLVLLCLIQRRRRKPIFVMHREGRE